MQAFLDLVAAGRIDVASLITHRFPFSDALAAYDMITSSREASLAVILEYVAAPEIKKSARQCTVSPGMVTPAGQIGLGVLGAGNFAKSVLLPRFQRQANVKFKSVMTSKGFSAKAVVAQFRFDDCAESAEAIIESPMVNTLLVATRHNLHAHLVKKALEAGKHVFVEKPLCLTRSELDSIEDVYSSLVTRHSPPALIMVGFNRRFSPFAIKARDVLSSCNGPRVASYRVNAGFIPKDSWVQDPNEGGGRIVGEMCHFIDTLRFLVGSPVETVHAASVQTNDITQTNRDSVSVTLTYADGSIANILYHALGNGNYPKEQIEIASDGTIIAIDDYRTLQTYGKKSVKISGKQDKGFDGEIAAFIKAVRTGAPSPIPFSELYETTLVTFAVHHSLNTGNSVRLSEF